MVDLQIVQTFTCGAGTKNAAVLEVDGIALLFQRWSGWSFGQRCEEVRLFIWGPSWDGEQADNPGWDKIAELEAAGLVAHVREGYSIAPLDRYLWLGGEFDAEWRLTTPETS